MQCCQKAAFRAIAKSFLTTAALLLLLAACTPILRSHGYAPAEQDLAGLRVGVDTRRSVAEAVGTPALSGVQDEGNWYYVSSTVREFAYRRPEIIERELVAISFDRNGVVTNIRSGRFMADVTLTAKFSDTTPMLGGTIDKFRAAEGSSPGVVDSSWTVTLTETASDGGTVATGVADASGQDGAWEATSYGEAGMRPAGIYGGFNAHFTDGHAAGAWATRKKK